MAATVDSVVITNQEVDRSLALQNPADGFEPSAVVRRRALDDLINQQLVVAKAEDERLDHQPEIMNTLEETHRQSLARAYLEQAAKNLPSPGDDEVHTYYIDHPELFAERRIYTLNELTVADQPEVADQLNSLAVQGAPYAQLETWLRTRHIRFSTEATARPAESLPLAYLPRLAQLETGRSLVMSDDRGVHAAQIINAQPAPVSELAAAPSIRRFLERQNQQQAMEAEIVRLRAHSKIQYATSGTTGESATIKTNRDAAEQALAAAK